MKLRATADGNFLQVIDSTELELEQLTFSFTKRVDNYFIIKKKIPHWDGEVRFIDRYSRIPIGLWKEVKNFCDKYNFQLEIDNASTILMDPNFNDQDFDDWVEEYFSDAENFYPRDYQIEACKRVIKYRFCMEEISTSGGKTLITFMIFKYLMDRGLIKRMLYVVPNVNLVTQTEEKFYEYEDRCNRKPKWKSMCVYSSAKKVEGDINVVFGTFQSLSKKPLEYFSSFDAVCIDECLHPDTLITMEDFSKRKICDVKIGERVWTLNEKTNKLEIKEVEFVYKNLSVSEQMYELKMEDDSILYVTGNHKVLTNGNIWKRVDTLTEKDEIISFNIMNI